MKTIQDGVSTTREAVAMVALYFLYVGFVVGRYVWTLSRREIPSSDAEEGSEETRGDDRPLSPIPLAVSAEGLEAESHTNKFSACFERLTRPLTAVFRLIVPSVRSIDLHGAQYSPLRKKDNIDAESLETDQLPVRVSHPQRYLSCLLRRQSEYEGGDTGQHSSIALCHPLATGTDQIIGLLRANLCRALLCIFTCIVYIGLLASLIVQASSVIVTHLGLSQTTIGATFVSLGTEVADLSSPFRSYPSQIPDLVSSIVLARDGYYAAALAGATGSQVINITLGTGLPALMMCLYGDGNFHVDDQTAR
jgi:Ca2+/Na+ antiporter